MTQRGSFLSLKTTPATAPTHLQLRVASPPSMLPTVLKTPSSPLWTRRRLSNAPSTRRRESSAGPRPATPTVDQASTNFSFEYDPNPVLETTLISPATTILRSRAASMFNASGMRSAESWAPTSACPQTICWHPGGKTGKDESRSWVNDEKD